MLLDKMRNEANAFAKNNTCKYIKFKTTTTTALL